MMTLQEFMAVWWRALLLRLVLGWILLLGTAALFGFLIPPLEALGLAVIAMVVGGVTERFYKPSSGKSGPARQ